MKVGKTSQSELEPIIQEGGRRGEIYSRLRALGGHILEAHVWPTLEVVLTESPRHLRRKIDDETGLALIELEEG
jgi:hypothetical protein